MFFTTMYIVVVFQKVLYNTRQSKFWKKVWCIPVQRGNLRKTLLEPCRQRIMCKKVLYNPVDGGNDMKFFVQPCTTQELVKSVYFDPSVPNQTHLCHLCLASVPSEDDWSHPATNFCQIFMPVYTGNLIKYNVQPCSCMEILIQPCR